MPKLANGSTYRVLRGGHVYQYVRTSDHEQPSDYRTIKRYLGMVTQLPHLYGKWSASVPTPWDRGAGRSFDAKGAYDTQAEAVQRLWDERR